MPKTPIESLNYPGKYGNVIVYFQPKGEVAEAVIYFTLKPGCGYKVYHRDWNEMRGIASKHANNRIDWEFPKYLLEHPAETLPPIIEAIIEWHVVNNELFIWDLEPDKASQEEV